MKIKDGMKVKIMDNQSWGQHPIGTIGIVRNYEEGVFEVWHNNEYWYYAECDVEIVEEENENS